MASNPRQFRTPYDTYRGRTDAIDPGPHLDERFRYGNHFGLLCAIFKPARALGTRRRHDRVRIPVTVPFESEFRAAKTFRLGFHISFR